MPSKFIRELTIFHEEQAIAQRCFFGYLAIRNKALEDKELLGLVNSNPWFWLTVDYSLLLGTLVGLGRIFGTGRHNIGKLLSVVEENREEFSLQALERRLSKKLTSAEVAKYLKQVHEVSEANVDELKREVDKWRGVYQQDYKDIRDKVFAHRVMSSLDEMNVLFAKTKVEELKRLLHFLNSLYLALFAAHTNGVAVKLDSYDPQWFIGEQVRLEGERVLKWMVEEARGWPQRAVSESHFIITDKVSLCTLSRYRCPATGSAKKPTTR